MKIVAMLSKLANKLVGLFRRKRPRLSVPLTENLEMLVLKIPNFKVPEVRGRPAQPSNPQDQQPLAAIPDEDRRVIDNMLREHSKKIPAGEMVHYLVIYMGEDEMNHLNSLTRYFELNHFHLFLRGMWLMTVLRDAQLEGKELAIVTIDKSSNSISDYLTINPY